MRVLVACEFSGIVRDAFAAKGHDAWSCDLLPTERPGQHIQDDVLKHLEDGWDLMIAHPPCQYLSYAGIAHWNKPGRKEKREAALEFFIKLFDSPIDKVAIENPIGYPNSVFASPHQIIQPFYFGDRERKPICLWLKGLHPLVWRETDELFGKRTCVEPPEASYIQKTGKQKGRKRYMVDAMRGGKNRQKNRSRFFPGIAAAMASQWG